MTLSASTVRDTGRGTAHRFTDSALTRDNRFMSTADFLAWWRERHRALSFEVRQIPFAELNGWHFERTTGNLVHASGRFFAIEGLRVDTDRGSWSQPVINQPEIGILGILAKEFDGVLHLLMQAKMEPGNVNTLQLSPTVQATRSNYTRVHLGGGTRYLEYFVEPRPGRVLVDVLQSEQGAWFYRKRNRNILIETTDDVPVHEDYCWLTLGQLRELLAYDNLVNMDARTVLSCIPYAAPAHSGGDGFRDGLVRSLAARQGRHSLQQLRTWLNDAKSHRHLEAYRIPLAHVEGWRRTDDEIVARDGGEFSIIAVSASAPNREVRSWTQPLLAPHRGIAALLAKRIDGVVHFLMHADLEPGNIDVVELGPTVRCSADPESLPRADRPPFLSEVLEAGPEAIRYDAVQSEEGGRFHHAQNRYMVVEAGDGVPDAEPDGYRWVTLHQLGVLCQESYRLNIHARSLLAAVNSLW